MAAEIRNQPIQTNAQPVPEQESTWSDIVKRTTVAALPFVTLYKPLSFPVAIAAGLVRSSIHAFGLFNSLAEGEVEKIPYQLLETSISVIAVAGTLFAHPVGMIITTAHDLANEIANFVTALMDGEYKKACESCALILNNVLYFGLLYYGGLEMMIATFAMQALLAFYYSQKEFGEGHYIEGVAHMLMGALRTHNMVDKVQALQAKQAIMKVLTSGRIGEKWQFPSDHLPVGTKVGNSTIITWNVLNSEYMTWVYNDSQGLNGSMLTQLDKPSPHNPAITMREELVIQYIMDMIHNADHDNLILSLQECGVAFTEALMQSLPPNMGIVLSDPKLVARDLNVTIYDKDRYNYMADSSRVVYDAFPKSDKERPLMDLLFKEKATGQLFQVFNVHIPGDPTKPGRNEFAKYVLTHSLKGCTTLALGDMNFTEKEMASAFAKEAKKLGIKSPFFNLVKYNTNINPGDFTPKSIDHIWISSDLPCKVLTPDQILPGLQKTVDLLQPKKVEDSNFIADYWNRFWAKKEQESVREENLEATALSQSLVA